MFAVNATIHLMARPRVFLSSTYYGLEHLRDLLGDFIEKFGFETVRFELGQVPYDHQQTLDESCYDEVGRCDIFILVIGHRYGSAASDQAEDGLPRETFESVTKREYKRAVSADIPIYVFVEKPVLEACRTFEANDGSLEVKYPQVDDPQLLRFLAEIKAEPCNNPIQSFEHFNDIGKWLREQWAGLFQSMLASRRQDKTLADMASQLSQLQAVTSTLKAYTEKLAEVQLEPATVTALRDDEAWRVLRSVVQMLAMHPAVERLAELTGRSRLVAVSAVAAFEGEREVAMHLGMSGVRQVPKGQAYEFGHRMISARTFKSICDNLRADLHMQLSDLGVDLDALRRSPGFKAALLGSHRTAGGEE